MCFKRVPTAGTGAIATTPKHSPSSKDLYQANLSNFKNSIEDFNHITLEQVMAFTSWFMGDDNQALVVCPLMDMKMKYLDAKAPGNVRLVVCFKQKCCTVSCLVWHTIKNHLTATSYKAPLVHKREFAYECDKTGDITYESITLLRMIYIFVKPNIVVDVKDLQNKTEKMTLLTCDSNFHTLATSLEELRQESNADKGEDFLKDNKLLTELFLRCRGHNQ
jgi:hypothetical protein